MTAAVAPVQIRISGHALLRYQERVAQVTYTSARQEIGQLLAGAKRRPKPRHWMPVPITPGSLYLYAAGQADVCLVVRGDVVVTVYSRHTFRVRPKAEHSAGESSNFAGFARRRGGAHHR